VEQKQKELKSQFESLKIKFQRTFSDFNKKADGVIAESDKIKKENEKFRFDLDKSN
jgi:hypothetical protein